MEPLLAVLFDGWKGVAQALLTSSATKESVLAWLIANKMTVPNFRRLQLDLHAQVFPEYCQPRIEACTRLCSIAQHLQHVSEQTNFDELSVDALQKVRRTMNECFAVPIEVAGDQLVSECIAEFSKSAAMDPKNGMWAGFNEGVQKHGIVVLSGLKDKIASLFPPGRIERVELAGVDPDSIVIEASVFKVALDWSNQTGDKSLANDLSWIHHFYKLYSCLINLRVLADKAFKPGCSSLSCGITESQSYLEPSDHSS